MTRVHFLLTTAVAAGVAGCSFTPLADSDAATGDDDTFDARPLIDAPPVDQDAPPPADTDLDTIPDATDNCPTIANTAQLNEDGDDRGNACDLCPHMVGAVPGTDADTDTDGIGDQCDPRVGADRLVVFLGFDGTDELAAFSSRAGSNMWSISGGQLHQTSPSLTAAQQVVWTGESIVGTVVAETMIHVDDVPSPASAGSRLAVVSGGYYDPGTPPDAYGCGIRAASAAAAATVVAVHYVGPPAVGDIMVGPLADALSIGMSVFVRLVATQTNPDSTLNCTANTAPANLAVSNYYPEGFPGFRTLGLVASFDYLFVVEVGP